MSLTINTVQGWSTSPSYLNSVLPAFPSFPSNCEERFATTNLNSCESSLILSDTDANLNPSKSPVTVMRKNTDNQTTQLILNDIILSSTDTKSFNVHDYAIFVQPVVLPQWWFNEIRQRSTKITANTTSSSALWAKVRAVTYMTTLAHRTGSWYSDDQTGKSSEEKEENSSTSDVDEKDPLANVELDQTKTCDETDLPIPLRRSFSSIGYVTREENYSSPLPRSHSTTRIDTNDLSFEPSSIVLPPSSPTPPLPSPQPSTSSRVYRFLHCIIL